MLSADIKKPERAHNGFYYPTEKCAIERWGPSAKTKLIGEIKTWSFPTNDTQVAMLTVKYGLVFIPRSYLRSALELHQVTA